jgi:hypothetical protein
MWCGVPSPRTSNRGRYSELWSLDHLSHVRRTQIRKSMLFQTSSLFHKTVELKTLSMNISGTLNVFRLIWSPTLCLPQHTISTFNHLPVPLSKAFPQKDGDDRQPVDIRAVVLDKDDCFAIPHTNEVYKPYEVQL